MVLTKLRVIAALAIVVPGSIKAQEVSSPRPRLITHDELQKRLSDPKLRLLDARTKEVYDQGHSRVLSGSMPRPRRPWPRDRGD